MGDGARGQWAIFTKILLDIDIDVFYLYML